MMLLLPLESIYLTSFLYPIITAGAVTYLKVRVRPFPSLGVGIRVGLVMPVLKGGVVRGKGGDFN
jgi:hypothetical protein